MSFDFGLKSINTTELPVFDPTSKKKKKKVTVALVKPVESMEPVKPTTKEALTPTESQLDDEFDFGKKKKKKAPIVAVTTTTVSVAVESIAEVDGDYDYFSLLQRVCNNLGKTADNSTTLALPDLIVEPEGTTKTVWRNIARVGQKLNRDIDHIRKFSFQF